MLAPAIHALLARRDRPAPTPEAPCPQPSLRAARLKAPVLGLYGAKDSLADTVPTMRAALAAARKTGNEIIGHSVFRRRGAGNSIRRPYTPPRIKLKRERCEN